MSDAARSRVGDEVREVVVEPDDQTAGVAVTRMADPGPHHAEFTVEQLWPDGTADPVHVGDTDDVLQLIEALAEVARDAE